MNQPSPVGLLFSVETDQAVEHALGDAEVPSLRVTLDERHTGEAVTLDVYPDGTFTGVPTAEEALRVIGRAFSPELLGFTDPAIYSPVAPA